VHPVKFVMWALGSYGLARVFGGIVRVLALAYFALPFLAGAEPRVDRAR
jgi:hypothetical protein